MSKPRREKATVEEFQDLVKQYYEEKKEYDEKFYQALDSLPSDNMSSGTGNKTEELKKDEGQAQTKATAQDHHAMPGPVIAEGLGKPASKEELRARAEELNKPTAEKGGGELKK